MKSKLKLKKNPTLKDFQKYIKDMVKERGFQKEHISEIFLLLVEEVGEMAKAIRKLHGIHIDAKSKTYDLSHEAVDVFMYVMDICNFYKIDLEKAFREKEEINKKRIWN